MFKRVRGREEEEREERGYGGTDTWNVCAVRTVVRAKVLIIGKNIQFCR